MLKCIEFGKQKTAVFSSGFSNSKFWSCVLLQCFDDTEFDTVFHQVFANGISVIVAR